MIVFYLLIIALITQCSALNVTDNGTITTIPSPALFLLLRHNDVLLLAEDKPVFFFYGVVDCDTTTETIVEALEGRNPEEYVLLAKFEGACTFAEIILDEVLGVGFAGLVFGFDTGRQEGYAARTGKDGLPEGFLETFDGFEVPIVEISLDSFEALVEMYERNPNITISVHNHDTNYFYETISAPLVILHQVINYVILAIVLVFVIYKLVIVIQNQKDNRAIIFTLIGFLIWFDVLLCIRNIDPMGSYFISTNLMRSYLGMASLWTILQLTTLISMLWIQILMNRLKKKVSSLFRLVLKISFIISLVLGGLLGALGFFFYLGLVSVLDIAIPILLLVYIAVIVLFIYSFLKMFCYHRKQNKQMNNAGHFIIHGLFIVIYLGTNVFYSITDTATGVITGRYIYNISEIVILINLAISIKAKVLKHSSKSLSKAVQLE